MTTQETAWQSAESAAAVLAPESGVIAWADSAGLGEATLAVMQRAARQPNALGAAALRFWTSMAMTGPVAAARWMGMEAAPPVAVPDGDRRFADKTWTDNPAFFALRQGYLATSQLVSDLLDAGSGDATDDAKARIATGFLLARSPRRTSCLPTRPRSSARSRPAGPAWPPGPGSSSMTCSTTTGVPARWTPGRSRSGRTWPAPRARSCSRTS
jgi:polyhydroxyalkanoate synthase